MAKHETHCCIDCAIAKVFQFDFDPIIAECSDGQRNVARYPVACKRFKPLRKIRCIDNRKKKIGF